MLKMECYGYASNGLFLNQWKTKIRLSSDFFFNCVLKKFCSLLGNAVSHVVFISVSFSLPLTDCILILGVPSNLFNDLRLCCI